MAMEVETARPDVLTLQARLEQLEAAIERAAGLSTKIIGMDQAASAPKDSGILSTVDRCISLMAETNERLALL